MNEKRLLIVDDEPAFGDFVRQVALNLGYAVQVVTDGKACQECYANFQPTTIMLDMVMPDMDGNELLLWLVQQGYSADLVITTGYNPDYASDAKTLAEFNGLRSVTTLVKPFSLARLRTLLSDQPQAAAPAATR